MSYTRAATRTICNAWYGTRCQGFRRLRDAVSERSHHRNHTLSILKFIQYLGELFTLTPRTFVPNWITELRMLASVSFYVRTQKTEYHAQAWRQRASGMQRLDERQALTSMGCLTAWAFLATSREAFSIFLKTSIRGLEVPSVCLHQTALENQNTEAWKLSSTTDGDAINSPIDRP
jgi:hypothetical protein